MRLVAYIAQSGSPACVWAGRLGVSGGYLSQLLSGQKLPSLRLAVKIERATGGRVPASSWVPDARSGSDVLPPPGAALAWSENVDVDPDEAGVVADAAEAGGEGHRGGILTGDAGGGLGRHVPEGEAA